MAFFKHMTDMHRVNFGHKFLWDVKFIDPPIPPPFDTWFPASQVKLDLFKLNSTQIKSNIGMITLPSGKSVGDNSFELTFYDDENGTIEEWMEDWVQQVMFAKENGNYSVTGTLDQCCRIVQLVRTTKDIKNNPTRIITSTANKHRWERTIAVFPDGELSFIGESDAGFHVYTINFIVAGYVESYWY